MVQVLTELSTCKKVKKKQKIKLLNSLKTQKMYNNAKKKLLYL